MKILESVPDRYDKGIRLLTLGRLDNAYDRLTAHIKKGQRVLDIGCGTGALTLRAARKGARVTGIDINPQMLEIAQKQIAKAGVASNVELREMGIAELETEKSHRYDVVMSGLCFSELSEDEINYALKEIRRLLKPGGILLIADEVKPKSVVKRVITSLIRFPLSIVVYLFTQTTTGAVKNLPEKVENAGFQIASIRLNAFGNFIEIIAVNPGEK